MGTSPSGLTIDHVTHMVGHVGTPRVIFNMNDALMRSMDDNGGFDATHDVFVQGLIAQSDGHQCSRWP